MRFGVNFRNKMDWDYKYSSKAVIFGIPKIKTIYTIMLTLKKRLATIIFLALFSTATLVSCGGKQAADTEEAAEEHPADSVEHPADSTDHPEGEHPADSTSVQ